MATLEERERKGSLNQVLLRNVNERVVEMKTAVEASACERLDLLCERFDRGDSVDTISLTLQEYETIRESPVRFPVKAGHVIPEIEHVVDRNDRMRSSRSSATGAGSRRSVIPVLEREDEWRVEELERRRGLIHVHWPESEFKNKVLGALDEPIAEPAALRGTR